MRFLATVLLLVASGAGQSDVRRETIRDFRAHVTVGANGILHVVETIQIGVRGEAIKRGILRTIPHSAYGPWFTVVNMPLTVISVTRDGKPEPWLETESENGLTIRIGQEDVLLPFGVHTYEIEYETSGWLTFGDDHDEIRWNATGHDWTFTIERSSTTVVLPEGVDISQATVDSWIGNLRTKGVKATVRRGEKDRSITFDSAARLDPGQGVTVSVRWPRGHVTRPTDDDVEATFFRSNSHLLAAPFGVLLVLALCFGFWWAVGRDRRRGTVYPRFSPPEGLSPAAMRYVVRRGYDFKCLATALVSLASKGVLTISEDDDEWKLDRIVLPPKKRKRRKRSGKQRKRNRKGRRRRREERLKNRYPEPSAPLSTGETEVRDGLFYGSVTSSRLGRKASPEIEDASESLSLTLEFEFEDAAFRLNRGWTTPGILMSVATLVMCCGSAGEAGGRFCLMTATFVIASLAAAACGRGAARAWKVVRASSSGKGRSRSLKRLGGYGGGLAASVGLFALVTWILLRGQASGLLSPTAVSAIWMAPVVVTLTVINIVFRRLMEAPTAAGGHLLDEIEGFAMYLGTAEARELSMVGSPELTPELYHRHLPYAMALDLENAWAERFTEVLGASALDDLQPSWLATTHRSRRFSDFGSFSSDISSTVTTSSNFGSSIGGSFSGGGGGFSGGGGGGGGGSGW